MIPKIQDPQNINEYIPISLIGCIYKAVAKILTRRHKKVMATIIDERQSAFIEGRHLLHNMVIANEAFDEAKRGRKSCLVFKVSNEKAYDSVCWDFLLYMLGRMGFYEKWVMWIDGCLKFSFVSVLVNGCPIDESSPQRGIRQGDPLAPFLFNIVAKGLTGLMREAQKKNLFKGFLVGRDKVEISILQ